jgi:hypothetical protein
VREFEAAGSVGIPISVIGRFGLNGEMIRLLWISIFFLNPRLSERGTRKKYPSSILGMPHAKSQITTFRFQTW